MTDIKSTVGQEFTVTSSRETDAGIITLSGYISSPAEDAMLRAHAELDGQGIHSVHVRFHDRFIITSAGIAVLITIAAQEKKKKRPVIVEGLTPHYKKIFEMIGLSDYVKIDK